MRVSLSLLALIFPIFLLAQSSKNLELVANVAPIETCNDVWGFLHSNGTEYAIMGDQNSTRIFSLADPANPAQVADIEGTSSTWRDIKNFNDIVYVVADSGRDGLLVIDMSMIDQDSVSHTFWNLEIPYQIQLNGEMDADTTVVDSLTRSHNVFIDDAGYMYLAGSNVSNRGVIILDLNSNPLLPKVIGLADRQYAHDVFVRDTLMYASEIFAGQMGIYSVADKANPVLLGTINTPNNFTHNIWSDDSNQYAFTTDERGESSVGSYDVSDPSNIKFLDKFKTVDGVGAIPHNTHYLDNYLYTSWYTEGVIVTDVTRPDNMVEVGHYDTWDGESGGFNGCWGAYPFLPSGLLLASDRQSGLYVLQPTLIRASYLEGTITEAGTTNPVTGANIKINSDDKNDSSSDPTGAFKTGQCTAGSFSVTISHPEYFDLDTTIMLSAGEVTMLDIQLVKKALYAFQANTGIENGEPLAHTDVILTNDDQTYELNSAQEGLAFREVFEGSYQLFAGRWGWKQVDYGTINIDDVTNVSIVLEPGYEDDFVFDFGWTVESNATSGEWQRAEPIATTFNGLKSNVDIDIVGDIGKSCYVTGNAGGQAGTDDVDNGTTTLTSDWIDLSDYNEPYLEYYKWFFNAGGERVDPNDTLRTVILTKLDTIVVDTTTGMNISGEWVRSSIDVREFISEDSIRVMFVVADDEEDGHVLEAGIDVFRISEGTTISTDEVEQVEHFTVFPNPVDEQLTIKSDTYLGEAVIRVFDIQGKLVYRDRLTTREKTISLNHLMTGTYFLNVNGKDFKQSIKLIKS